MASPKNKATKSYGSPAEMAEAYSNQVSHIYPPIQSPQAEFGTKLDQSQLAMMISEDSSKVGLIYEAINGLRDDVKNIHNYIYHIAAKAMGVTHLSSAAVPENETERPSEGFLSDFLTNISEINDIVTVVTTELDRLYNQVK